MRKSLLGALFLLFVAACGAVGPDYHPPQPELIEGWHETAPNTRLSEPAALDRWWALFNDPLLESLVSRATQANYELRRAEAAIRAARAERVIAAATGSIDATAGFTSSRRSENIATTSSTVREQELFQAGFDAGWELDLFGGVRRAVEAAEASIAASEAELHDVLVSLQAEVAVNYVELRGAQRRLAVASKNIATQEKTVELVRGRFELGLGNELDLVQAETQLLLIKAQIPTLENLAHRAMHRLAVLTAEPPGSLVTLLAPSRAIPAGPELLPITLPSELLRQRPDIRAAERRLAEATAGIGVATAELYPRFSLTALIGLQSRDLGELVNFSSRFWTAGPAIDLSLFDQGSRRAAITNAEARKDSALAFYQQTVLSALAEVEDGLSAFSSEQETRRRLQEAVASGEKAVHIAYGRYETGLADFLNVLQSEQALYQSEDQLAESEQRLILAMVAVFKALGGGWGHGVASEPSAAEKSAPALSRANPQPDESES